MLVIVGLYIPHLFLARVSVSFGMDKTPVIDAVMELEGFKQHSSDTVVVEQGAHPQHSVESDIPDDSNKHSTVDVHQGHERHSHSAVETVMWLEGFQQIQASEKNDLNEDKEKPTNAPVPDSKERSSDFATSDTDYNWIPPF
jgi:hypothetical protein